MKLASVNEALFECGEGALMRLSQPCRTLEFPADGGLDFIFSEIEAASQAGQWVSVAAKYELGLCLDPAFADEVASREGALFSATFYKCAEQLSPEKAKAFFEVRLSALSEHERAAGVYGVAPAWDVVSYSEKIGKIHQWIAEGDCYQINLTFPLEFSYYGHPLALYSDLRQHQSVKFGAYLNVAGQTILSFSPELFFERNQGRIVTKPMKGTAPRGANSEEDAACRLALVSSQKERAENVMIVDLLRNDLGKVVGAGKVHVEALCVAEPYPTLWQMVSTVVADDATVPLASLFRSLFPCGSITGAPKIQAMRRIGMLETSPRGFYTGALGWVAPDGRCQLNVAIRTIVLDGEGRGRMGVGSGVVIDGDALAEYRECLLKARFLTSFDPGFQLIETLRLASGAFPLLSGHLSRLRASATELGFAFDESAVMASLTQLRESHLSGLWRVRLVLSHGGSHQVAIFPMQEIEAPQSVVLANERLASSSRLLRHKTTVRQLYDATLQSLSTQDNVFDAIFLNERGEVCEGARSNVFVQKNGQLFTPPLHCGLLAGVLRQSLLNEGRVIEKVLTVNDLTGADSLFLGNALRGLIPVTLLDV